jgi:hypothetical protein
MGHLASGTVLWLAEGLNFRANNRDQLVHFKTLNYSLFALRNPPLPFTLFPPIMFWLSRLFGFLHDDVQTCISAKRNVH